MRDGNGPWYVVEPEVPGGLGERTVMDRAVHPPRVERLHVEVADWLGDGLLECFPCFLVTAPVREALEVSGLTGFRFADAEVTTATPDAPVDLPSLSWLQVSGEAAAVDVALTPDGRLLVSDAALGVLRDGGLQQAIVEPYAV